MPTTSIIRRHIARLLSDKPFSIRDFLGYGSRAAVDQAFHRLVERGEIVRVARGLFIKATAPCPSVLEVALAKAAAFKKTIATHGSTAASALASTKPMEGSAVFASNGHSSSFRFGQIVIKFVGTCARKMHMNNSKLGLAIRALWYLGQAVCDNHLASLAVQSFGRTDRQQLRQNVDLMPAWMHKYFLDLTSRRIEMKPCTN